MSSQEIYTHHTESHDEENHTCGFCMVDTKQKEHLWKCAQCTWVGHPACWLMLRQDVCTNKHLIHMNDPRNITPWVLPKGKCPQCRQNIAWKPFIDKQRTDMVMDSFKNYNQCWICQENIEMNRKHRKEVWKCDGRDGNHSHPNIFVHYDCLWNLSGYGTCMPECILCGSVPKFIKKRHQIILEWRNKLLELKKLYPPGNLYHLFFNDNRFGDMNINDVEIILNEYLHFLQKGPMSRPMEWWKTMHLTTIFIFNHMKYIQTFLLSLEQKYQTEFLAQSRKTLFEWIDKMIQCKALNDNLYPKAKTFRVNYHCQINRVSPPISGEFFPYLWLNEYTSCIADEQITDTNNIVQQQTTHT